MMDGMRTFATIAFSGALLAVGCLAADEVWLKDDSLVAKVEKKVHQSQPKPEEKRFDLVGWAPDIFTAEKLAKQQNRPVFLFTYDGTLETGHC
jgi:hypothetical protein